ncbi:MAG TPA: DinB family protein [Dehalococcoidia bacterium]|nr:DinB family protein [Dehalococcoidia bacterium]
MATRERELEALHTNTNALLSELRDLPEAKLTEVWLGSWSARELLVHLGAWCNMMGQAYERMARGERPSPEGVDLSDNDGMNARYVEEAHGKSIAQVRKDLETGMARFEAAAKALPEDRFAEGKTAMRIMQTIAGHPLEHIEEVRAWRHGAPAPGRD